MLNVDKLNEHVYEIDQETDPKCRNENRNNGKNVKFKGNSSKNIEKQGWLLYKLTSATDVNPNKVDY